MFIVFLCIAGVSFLLLLASAIFGGDHEFGEHEVGFEHGYEAEADADHDHEHPGGPSPFSVKILSVFGTTFGAVGAISTHYGLSGGFSSLIGLAVGFPIGWLAFQFYKYMFRLQASSTVSACEAVGGLAEVHTAIPANGLGEVSFVTKGQRTYLPARSEDGAGIPAGSTVEVVANPSGTLVVRKK